MVMMNHLDRYHLVMDVIDRVPGLGSRAAGLRQLMADTRRRARAWTREHGEDLPEVREWRWAAAAPEQGRSPSRTAQPRARRSQLMACLCTLTPCGGRSPAVVDGDGQGGHPSAVGADRSGGSRTGAPYLDLAQSRKARTPMNANGSEPAPHVANLIARACRAPSVHNSQPWLWLVDGHEVSLFADYRRQLEHTDPAGRDLVISCGAALHHLNVAAAAAGWEARSRRLPNPYNDAQLATVTFDACAVSVEDTRAAEALGSRRTDRRRTAPSPVARDQLEPLLAAAGHFGVVAFAVVSSRARAMLLNLLAEADSTQRRDPRYLEETTAWIDRPAGEGIPSMNLLQHPPAVGDQGASTRFPPGTLSDPHPSGAGEPVDALLTICTSSDDVASQLRAGEALSAILLTGESDGLSMLPLSQATEVDRTRHLLQNELLRDAAYPQILVRVGRRFDNLEPLPPTPRRPLSEVLCDPASLPESCGPYLRPGGAPAR